MPGWNGLIANEDSNAPTTGVVTLQGAVKGLSDSDALSAVTVSVEDASSQPIAGSLSLHDLGPAQMDITGQGREVLVVWKPNAPLAPNAQYQVSWSVAESALATHHLTSSGQLSLSTVGAPAPTAKLATTQAAFRRERRLVGEPVTCERELMSTCGPSVASFGSTEAQVPMLDLSFAPPPSPASHYLITRVEPVPGKGVPVSLPAPIVSLPPFDEATQLATLELSDDVEEYCVRLVTEDLTSGVVHTSPDVCAARDDAEAPGSSLLEQTLSYCKAPPSAALTPAWCKTHPNAAECDDAGASSCSLPRAPSSSSAGFAALLALCLGALGRRASRP